MLIFLLGFAVPSAAKTQAIPPLPQDFSKIDILLGTRDIGHEVYAKYGHTIVRVVNHENGTDVAYNWGTFDFSEPGYVSKFLKGILIYRMSFGPWWREVEASEDAKQTMWLERVNFTTKQKETLLRRVHWQAQPENVKYPYLFFYDNCSTRVRDLFDEALNGRIKARAFGTKLGASYRDRVWEHNASLPFFAVGQDVILNSEPDKELSSWDDMFIPIKLRAFLRDMPAFDDNGQEIPGVKLLSDSRTLTEFPQPEIPLANGYAIFWILAGIPVLAGMFLRRTRRKNLGGRLIGLANVVLGATWGLFSVFMALSWLFGSHTVLPRNANLWLMWPTDFLYVILGVKLLGHGGWVAANQTFRRVIWCYTGAHLIAVVILAILGLSHLLSQDVTRSVCWFGPLSVLVFSAATNWKPVISMSDASHQTW